MMSRRSRISSGKSQSVPIQRQKFNAIPRKQYNVLLLGETGVGKSTFINSFYNYFRFGSLDEAEKNGQFSLIPFRLTILDKNKELRTVEHGSDPNENMDSYGQSSTQSCKAYEFPMDKFLLRIIDTPGVGDCRGVDQDRKVVNGILQFIFEYAKLHAICIVLRPYCSKQLTPLFSFCLKQLLSCLHRSALNNIIFIFTNSKNSFYPSGNVVVPLKTLLGKIQSTPPHPKVPHRKGNIFSLPNEAFRYLAARKNGIDFSDEDRLEYDKSWIKSVKESQRLIRYIVEGNSNGHRLTSHDVEATLAVNAARDVIIEMETRIIQLTKNFQKRFQEYSEARLLTKAGIIQRGQKEMKTLKTKAKKCEAEKQFLVDSRDKLAVFLKRNAIVSCNDSVKEYLSEMMKKEELLYRSGCGKAEVVEGLKKMYNKYKTKTDILQKAIDNCRCSQSLTMNDVAKIIEKFSNMKSTGIFN